MSSTVSHLVQTRPREAAALNTDALLIQRARGGDASAFEALVRRHIRTVLGLVRQSVRDEHAAEDAAQDALLIAYRSLRQLDDPSRFAAWLYTIALREARRASRKGGGVAAGAERESAVQEDPVRHERRASVRQAVADLDEPYRLVVTLKYLEGLNAAEIAERLNVPHGTVRAQLSRALPLLRAKLGRHV